ncbi:hypothetical protein EI555_006061 [Monodon monoceros]|uniref:TAFA chemokine like family member 5 n=1 Tax=Monodon monoceros TaxID=40151 RepID=A0A4U1F8J8_MONMO|nr:hypothetical protein EI555_006061 [Monodon monoceros]
MRSSGAGELEAALQAKSSQAGAAEAMAVCPGREELGGGLRIAAVDPWEPSEVRPTPCQLAAGTCEIVTLDRDSSQPRRTIARQTARCACRKGQIAGTTRARPACVDGPLQHR